MLLDFESLSADRTETSQTGQDSTPCHCFHEQWAPPLVVDADAEHAGADDEVVLVVAADAAVADVLRSQGHRPVLAQEVLHILLVACMKASLGSSILAEDSARSMAEGNLEAAVGMAERELRVPEYWREECQSDLDKDNKPRSRLLAVPETPRLIHSYAEAAGSRMAAGFVVGEHVTIEPQGSRSH